MLCFAFVRLVLVFVLICEDLPCQISIFIPQYLLIVLVTSSLIHFNVAITNSYSCIPCILDVIEMIEWPSSLQEQDEKENSIYDYNHLAIFRNENGNS